MRSDYQVIVMCEDSGCERVLVMRDELDLWEEMRRAGIKSGFANSWVVSCVELEANYDARGVKDEKARYEAMIDDALDRK